MLVYVRFGKGKKHLVMIPGLSTARVKDAALTLPLMYHKLGKSQTVWVFDKADHIPDGYTVRDMARDVANAMDELGIAKADVFGCSQGGMI
ncbi:MAG: alpha/beta hydrolase, partial [Clostridia bacterium]|nr:alpha/beta hydrolase [Clostridia bacterium]